MKNNLLQFKHIFLIFFMSSPLLTQAQQNKRDVIYLKNGSIIKGTILEMIPDQTIKIETADGSIFVYKLEEIEKTNTEEVTQTERQGGRRKRVKNGSIGKIEKFWPTGYFIMTKLGPTFNPTLFNASLGVQFINGLQINEYLSLGVGAEFTNFRYSDHSYTNDYSQNSSVSIFPDGSGSNVPVTPIFIDARFYIPLQRVHPMFSFQAGYSIVGHRQEDPTYYYTGFIPSSGNGGAYMAFAVGARIFINTKISIVTDGGLTFQSLNGYGSLHNGVQDNYQVKNITFMKANVGVIFSFGKNEKHE